MEKKQRMFYFGTNGCAGHYALPINSDLPDVKSDDWARFDGAMLVWIRKYGTYSQENYSVLSGLCMQFLGRLMMHAVVVTLISFGKASTLKKKWKHILSKTLFFVGSSVLSLKPTWCVKVTLFMRQTTRSSKSITLAQKEKFIMKPMQTMLVDEYNMNRTLVITDLSQVAILLPKSKSGGL